jgi:hypothetical protein
MNAHCPVLVLRDQDEVLRGGSNESEGTPVHVGCEARGIRPIGPLRKTGRVAADDHKPPMCEHGKWTFAGSDAKRGASKWRCPTGKCSPACVWVKADRLHTLVPRSTDRWGCSLPPAWGGRAGVRRPQAPVVAVAPACTPSARVGLHVDLTILARSAKALDYARAAHEAPSSMAA